MYARYTTVRGDPDKIDAAIEYVDGPCRAEVEATPGNLGFAVIADPDGGRIIGASYWDSAESLRASESALAGTRDQAASALRGRLEGIENFEVTLGLRRSIPERGALVRLARLRVDPARVGDAISLMREETAPRVKGADGLCSFQQLLDRETGAGVVVSCWETKEAAEAFWPVAQRLRERASERAGVRFEQLDDFVMIRSTVRLH